MNFVTGFASIGVMATFCAYPIAAQVADGYYSVASSSFFEMVYRTWFYG